MDNKINILRKPLILTSLPLGVMSFLIPIYTKELGMSAMEITGLFSILSLVLIIARPIIGKLTDEFGRKPVLIASCILFATSYLIFSIATTSALIYTARIFQGIATAAITISTCSIISDTTKENDLSKAFGSINSYKSTGYLYGCIIASIILSFMSLTQGWKVLFLIFFIAAIYSVIEVTKNIPESKRTVTGKYDVNKNTSKDTVNLLIIVFVTCVSSSILGPVFMIYMQDKFTNNILFLAYAFFPALIAEIVFSKRIGSISDKCGYKYSMILGILICAVISIITPSANSLFILAVLWVLSTLGGVLYGVSEKNIYTGMIDNSCVGVMYSIYSIVCDLGLMIGPLIGGLLYDYVSPKAPFYLSGFLMVIVSMLILILIKNNFINSNLANRLE
ncbi:MAG: MFS transporter [Peptostreptococcaceae bacterium]